MSCETRLSWPPHGEETRVLRHSCGICGVRGCSQITLCCKIVLWGFVSECKCGYVDAKSVQVKVKVAMRRTGMSTKLALDFHRRAPKCKQQAEKGQARSTPHVLLKKPRHFPAPGLSISKLARCHLMLLQSRLAILCELFPNRMCL